MAIATNQPSRPEGSPSLQDLGGGFNGIIFALDKRANSGEHHPVYTRASDRSFLLKGYRTGSLWLLLLEEQAYNPGNQPGDYADGYCGDQRADKAFYLETLHKSIGD